MVGLDDFATHMNRIAVQVEGNVEQAVKGSVINATLADTGRARSNWTAEMDQAFGKLFPPHVPGENGSTADANAEIAINQAIEVIDQFDINASRSVHISNSLPYIGALNDGHSKHAPADFVKLAVMDGLATVKGARILKE